MFAENVKNVQESGSLKMNKETLSDKIFSNFWIHTPKDSKEVKNVILAQDVKEKIISARTRIKSMDNWVSKKVFIEEVKRIFKEEFGGELT